MGARLWRESSLPVVTFGESSLPHSEPLTRSLHRMAQPTHLAFLY